MSNSYVKEKNNSQKNTWLCDPSLNEIPLHLTEILNQFIIPSQLKISKAPFREKESFEYGDCKFKIENKNIIFRIAKITPTKTGQFVTIWKRDTPEQEISPFDVKDNFDLIIICVFDESNKGIFLFDKNILLKKDLISSNEKGGKRGFRVYPPWCSPESKQALQTQKWQSEYFISFATENLNDIQSSVNRFLTTINH